ncbi:MAG: proteasome subunit beta [Acidimicrobiia bacterium]|nr:proteasome subunit beta [Acidimicrobiia bacterium]
MTMPRFAAGDDPGASFPDLLRKLGIDPFPSMSGAVVEANLRGGGSDNAIPHATTCLALTYDRGVVMAGDRRATMGNIISTRSVEKVVPADDLSGVAIAGTAGLAMEMIKLFQLQLEYYEKVEGQALSLEGKANQLSMMVRSNMPAAMQGLGVVPLFAGYDPLVSRGRLGGRYEERDFVAVGSGSMLASTVLRVGWRKNLSRDAAIELAARALWEASDTDTATGGPDILRGIYPIVASIDANGWSRVSDESLASTYEAIMREVRSR